MESRFPGGRCHLAGGGRVDIIEGIFRGRGVSQIRQVGRGEGGVQKEKSPDLKTPDIGICASGTPLK